MGYLEIIGGVPLEGSISVQGSKNGALPILAASLLGEGPCVIENCPAIRDVEDTLAILRTLGCRAERSGSVVTVDGTGADQFRVEGEAASRIRSSILFLGALLGKMGKAELTMPGGCAIGARPVDLHLEALSKLGVVFTQKEPQGGRAHRPADGTPMDGCFGEGCIRADGGRLHGGSVWLRFPSVGATENLILASVLSRGETVIGNAAREPEIDGLCRFLNLRGGRIRRGRDGSIQIKGVESLRPVTYRMRADRIVTGTYLLAAAATGGHIRIRNYPAGELDALLAVLGRMGAGFRVDYEEAVPGPGRGECLELWAPPRPMPVQRTETAPYPGFPTDLQSPLMAALCRASGKSRICERIFERRFRTAQELGKLGAHIFVEGSCAVIEGVESLRGTPLSAPDLRGGAALAVAALSAQGSTQLAGMSYIERGYEDLGRDLALLGAQVRYCPQEGRSGTANREQQEDKKDGLPG